MFTLLFLVYFNLAFAQNAADPCLSLLSGGRLILGRSQTPTDSAIPGLDVFTAGFNRRRFHLPKFVLPGREISLKVNDKRMTLQAFGKAIGSWPLGSISPWPMKNPVIKATFRVKNRVFILLGDGSTPELLGGRTIRILGFENGPTGLDLVVDQEQNGLGKGYSDRNAEERFIALPVQSGPDETTTHIHRENERIVRIHSTATTYDIVPAIVRLDLYGLNIYWFSENGIHEKWKRYSTAEIRADTVGPNHLQIRNFGDRGLHILYTNELYVETALVHDSENITHHYEFSPNAFPSIDVNSTTRFTHILPVQWAMAPGKSVDLYWAEHDKWGGTLFMLDQESGRAVYLNANRDRRRLPEPMRFFARAVGEETIRSLSDLVRAQNLFVPHLPKEFIGHFLRDDPQLQPGGRYHYLRK